MKIALTTPAFMPHGGIRIILEWANRLCAPGRQVVLFSEKAGDYSWFNLLPEVQITYSKEVILDADILIVCSPHSVELLKLPIKKRFIFLQMLEHMFNPSFAWQRKCMDFYAQEVPLISISQWNIAWLQRRFRTNRKYHYVGNGVNFEDFPIEYPEKDGRTILVEGLNSKNPTKDPQNITQFVAQRLHNDGWRVIGYGLTNPTAFQQKTLCDYYTLPSIEVLNELYSKATILLKATQYDARSCSPMEAMTKGCVPVRALLQGDDDLVNGQNCLRVRYGQSESLYNAATKVLTDKSLQERLANSCREYVQKYSWNHWWPKIESILGL